MRFRGDRVDSLSEGTSSYGRGYQNGHVVSREAQQLLRLSRTLQQARQLDCRARPADPSGAAQERVWSVGRASVAQRHRWQPLGRRRLAPEGGEAIDRDASREWEPTASAVRAGQPVAAPPTTARFLSVVSWLIRTVYSPTRSAKTEGFPPVFYVQFRLFRLRTPHCWGRLNPAHERYQICRWTNSVQNRKNKQNSTSSGPLSQLLQDLFYSWFFS